MCANLVFMCESTCAFILSAAFTGDTELDAMTEEEGDERRRREEGAALADESLAVAVADSRTVASREELVDGGCEWCE